MSAAFTIMCDPDRDLIRIAMSGFFTPADINDFLEARRKAHARLRCGPNQHLTINDLRGMKIQPSDSVTIFQHVLADPAYRSRRLAFVIASTLARSQLSRALSGRRDVGLFDDPHAAEVWLLGAEREMPLRRAVA